MLVPNVYSSDVWYSVEVVGMRAEKVNQALLLINVSGSSNAQEAGSKSRRRTRDNVFVLYSFSFSS